MNCVCDFSQLHKIGSTRTDEKMICNLSNIIEWMHDEAEAWIYVFWFEIQDTRGCLRCDRHKHFNFLDSNGIHLNHKLNRTSYQSIEV